MDTYQSSRNIKYGTTKINVSHYFTINLKPVIKIKQFATWDFQRERKDALTGPVRLDSRKHYLFGFIASIEEIVAVVSWGN
jgi:hypothetical protein